MNLLYNGAEYTEAQVAKTLKRLAAEEFKPYVRLLEKELVKQYETLAHATEPATLYRTQGRIAAYENLIEAIVRNHK